MERGRGARCAPWVLHDQHVGYPDAQPSSLRLGLHDEACTLLDAAAHAGGLDVAIVGSGRAPAYSKVRTVTVLKGRLLQRSCGNAGTVCGRPQRASSKELRRSCVVSNARDDKQVKGQRA